MATTRIQLDAALDERRLPDMEVLLDGQQHPPVGGRDDWSISLGSFWTGLSAGVEVIEICNGPLSVYVLPTRGMGIWNAQFNDLHLGWNSPTRNPVHPRFVNLQSRNGLGWLDGFNELLCRCGLAFNGPPGHDEGARSPIESEITLHGRISNIPAFDIELFADVETGEIGISGLVDECTLFGPQLRMKSTIVTKVGSSSFTVRDEITNLGSSSTELSLLYHTNVGKPFLDEGSIFECAADKIIPRDAQAAAGIQSYDSCLGPTPGFAEQVFYCNLLGDESGTTQTLLRNQSGDRGVSLKFSTKQLPCFAFWKCTQDERGGYVAGLEPAINYPNFKAFERHHGRLVNLEAGDTYTTEVAIGIHDSGESVQSVSSAIKQLQGGCVPKRHLTPVTPFCPID